MDIQELAAELDGREYMDEITDELAAVAHREGMIVMFGYSDDNVELRGAYSDEIGAYEGKTIYFDHLGPVTNKCECDDCPYFTKLKKSAVPVIALWDKDGYSWTFSTPINHVTFDIMEDGDKFCRGIVFKLDDVPA